MLTVDRAKFEQQCNVERIQKAVPREGFGDANRLGKVVAAYSRGAMSTEMSL